MLRAIAAAAAYATCPAPYDTFSFVTKIRVCKDDDGFITGLKTFSDHPTRHHDPTTVCDVVGRAAHCETIKLYDEDYKWRKYNVITNVRCALGALCLRIRPQSTPALHQPPPTTTPTNGNLAGWPRQRTLPDAGG